MNRSEVTRMIRDAVDRLVASLGELSAEQQVHAALAGRLSGILDGGEVPPYVLGPLARELRATVSTLVGAPGPQQGVVDEDELETLLRGGQ